MTNSWQKFRGTSWGNQFLFAVSALFFVDFLTTGLLTTGVESSVALIAAVVTAWIAIRCYELGQRSWESTCLAFIGEEVGLLESEEFRDWLMDHGKYRWADQLVDVDTGGENTSE